MSDESKFITTYLICADNILISSYFVLTAKLSIPKEILNCIELTRITQHTFRVGKPKISQQPLILRNIIIFSN